MNEAELCKNALVSNLKKYTRIPEKEIQELVLNIPIEQHSKGSVLLQQGSAPRSSYYLIKGCIRQYACDENGKEVTVNFFTEEESISVFSFLNEEAVSLYSLACLEDCMLVECPDLEDDPENDDSPEIGEMKRFFLERQFKKMQIDYTSFKLKTPKEKFIALLNNEPELMQRIPQVYLASYLGITPETFSRLKKKIVF